MSDDSHPADLPALDVPLLPRHFRGRRSVVEPLCARLRQQELLSSQVVGGPHSGKTSLLQWLASPHADADLGAAAATVRVYVDAAALGAQATPAQFWTLAFRELRAAPAAAALLAADADLAQALHTALQRAQSGALDLFDLHELFDGFAACNRPVVLLVDEFDTAIANPHFLPPAEFFNQVRNLCTRTPRGLAFLATSGRPLSDVGAAAAGASPPYNHFGTIAMDPLSDDDLRDQLAWLAQRRGVALPADAWRSVARWSDGQPLLASHLMRQMIDTQAAGGTFDDSLPAALAADEDGPYERLNRSILAALSAREHQCVQAWLADPASLTASQHTLLLRLRKFALLPPGVQL